MLKLTVTVMGERALMRSLSRFGEDVKDFRPLWRLIRDDFYRIEVQQFATQGARGGAAWAPLRPSYAAWKSMHFPGKPILEATGEMKRQMTAGVGMRVSMQPKTLVLSPTLSRARWHQAGTARMAARRVVQLTEADRQRWMKMLHEYVQKSARKEGLTKR